MKQTEGLYRVTRLLIQLVVGALALVVALGVVGYLFFMRSVDLPEARAIAERELAEGTLRFGERVVRAAHVYTRRPADYFRGANGVLAATTERLIFIGVGPSDRKASPDAPPVIIQQEFPNDTLLRLDRTRVFFGTARGVVVERAGRRARYGATSRHARELDELAAYVNRQRGQQVIQGSRERRVRAAVQQLVRQPLYYRVKRGDAISSLATWFGVSEADLQRWNNLAGPRIRIGDSLLVRRGTHSANQ